MGIERGFWDCLFKWFLILCSDNWNILWNKIIRQGKLIAVAFSLSTYSNQFSLGGVYNKNRCISVPLMSRVDKSITFDNLIIHIIIFYDQNIWLIFLCKRWIPCQAVTSVLCLLYSPETVHCRTKNKSTFEITIFTL